MKTLPKAQPLLDHGTLLGPSQLALLATAGISEVRVRPRPRVVIISTGRGLVEIGGSPGPGQVIDANSHALAAAARDAGAQPYRVGPLPEHPKLMLDALEDHLIRADIVIGTGAADIIAGDLATIGDIDPLPGRRRAGRQFQRRHDRAGPGALFRVARATRCRR